MNRTLANVLFISTILFFLAFVTWTGIYIVGNKQAFFGSPFTYGASKMGNVECSCIQYLENGLPAKFWFNDTDIKFGEEERRYSNKSSSKVNFSKLNITVVRNDTE